VSGRGGREDKGQKILPISTHRLPRWCRGWELGWAWTILGLTGFCSAEECTLALKEVLSMLKWTHRAGKWQLLGSCSCSLGQPGYSNCTLNASGFLEHGFRVCGMTGMGNFLPGVIELGSRQTCFRFWRFFDFGVFA
jgi:hypothetical protein